MQTVLWKTNKPKSIYQDFGLFVFHNTVSAWDAYKALGVSALTIECEIC